MIKHVKIRTTLLFLPTGWKDHIDSTSGWELVWRKNLWHQSPRHLPRHVRGGAQTASGQERHWLSRPTRVPLPQPQHDSLTTGTSTRCSQVQHLAELWDSAILVQEEIAERKLYLRLEFCAIKLHAPCSRLQLQEEVMFHLPERLMNGSFGDLETQLCISDMELESRPGWKSCSSQPHD